MTGAWMPLASLPEPHARAIEAALSHALGEPRGTVHVRDVRVVGSVLHCTVLLPAHAAEVIAQLGLSDPATDKRGDPPL